LDKITKEYHDKTEKSDRSEKKLKQTLAKVNVNVENSDVGLQINLNEELQKNRFLKNAISFLCGELPEMQTALDNNLQEIGIEINSRSFSEKAGNFYIYLDSEKGSKGSYSSKKSIR
jgi:hypothetical protein